MISSLLAEMRAQEPGGFFVFLHQADEEIVGAHIVKFFNSICRFAQRLNNCFVIVQQVCDHALFIRVDPWLFTQCSVFLHFRQRARGNTPNWRIRSAISSMLSSSCSYCDSNSW